MSDMRKSKDGLLDTYNKANKNSLVDDGGYKTASQFINQGNNKFVDDTPDSYDNGRKNYNTSSIVDNKPTEVMEESIQNMK